MNNGSLRKLLIVCADVKLRREIHDLAARWFQILQTKDARQALAWLTADAEIDVVVVDHSATGADKASGVTVLDRVRAIRPATRRVLLAESDDFASLIVGLHSGAIDQLVYKPVSAAALMPAIQPATPVPRKLSA